MSAIDADKLFYEFQALTTEEKQHFWSSLNGEGRYLLAARILAATDANAETIAETEANTETAAETVANTETIADANTFRARSAKPKRRPRTPRRGSAAGAGGAAAAVANTETIAETDANTEMAAEIANTQPVFEHSDQAPVEKQSQSEPASGGARAFGDDHASRQRGLRPNPVLTPPADGLKWWILERIGIPFIVVSAVACVIGLLFSYEESLHDSVLRPPSSLASRGGALPSVKSTRIESAMVDDGPAAAADSIRPASPSEKPTESQRPPRSTFIPPDQSALKAEVTGGSAMNQPMQPIPPASDTLPATNAAPISVPQSATPAPNDPPDQSALKAEVTGGSAMNQPMQPIPPASDTLPATNAAPISVPQSATPAPNDPPDQSALKAEVTGGSAMNQPMQPIPPASDTLPATNAAPISVPQSATPAPNDPPDQSALKAEVTGGSAMNQPMQPIPPASDTLPATNAAPISVPQSATPAPNDPAVQLDSDEMTRLIKRGKDFLAQGNFASARLLFKRAADAGSAEAALALGSTYDPSVIKQLGAVSITPDIDGALKWYRTAADRGSAEAANLFANLMRLRKAAMAAKPTAAKPRSETEPVEEKANSRTLTEPEVPPSTQPLATPGPVPKKEPTTIAGRTEGPASGQPAETSDAVLNKATTGIGGKAEGPATGQPSETSDPVLKKAKIMVAAKMEDPTYAEFVDMKRVMRKNSFGEPFEIICGHVKGKMESGEATGDRPFLYLVKEDEAFIVGGNPASMAAIVYRAHCISANSR